MLFVAVAELLDVHLEKAVYEETNYIRFWDDLLTSKQIERRRKGQETRLKMSKLPHRKILGDFDFLFQPSIAGGRYSGVGVNFFPALTLRVGSFYKLLVLTLT